MIYMTTDTILMTTFVAVPFGIGILTAGRGQR